MRTLLFLPFALASVSACLPDGLWEGADCCACLLLHTPDGERIDTSDSSAPLDGNCVPGAEPFDREQTTCSNDISFAISGGDEVPISDRRCVESACAAQCGAAEAKGISFVVVDEEGPSADAGVTMDGGS